MSFAKVVFLVIPSLFVLNTVYAKECGSCHSSGVNNYLSYDTRHGEKQISEINKLGSGTVYQVRNIEDITVIGTLQYIEQKKSYNERSIGSGIKFTHPVNSQKNISLGTPAKYAKQKLQVAMNDQMMSGMPLGWQFKVDKTLLMNDHQAV
jgi:hypothetical protein